MFNFGFYNYTNNFCNFNPFISNFKFMPILNFLPTFNFKFDIPKLPILPYKNFNTPNLNLATPYSINKPIIDNSIFKYERPRYNMQIPRFTMPKINPSSFYKNMGLNLSTQRTSTQTTTGASRVTESTGTTTRYQIGKFDLDFWKSKGYNHQKGMALALDAASIKKGKVGECVGYTRKTINRIYGTNFQNAGAAYRFGETILSSPQLRGKFKKVSMADVARGGIPDGAVVLWKPGAPGYTKGKAALYGHGGIAYQNKVYSNCVITDLSTCFEVWIPV